MQEIKEKKNISQFIIITIDLIKENNIDFRMINYNSNGYYITISEIYK